MGHTGMGKTYGRSTYTQFGEAESGQLAGASTASNASKDAVH